MRRLFLLGIFISRIKYLVMVFQLSAPVNGGFAEGKLAFCICSPMRRASPEIGAIVTVVLRRAGASPELGIDFEFSFNREAI